MATEIRLQERLQRLDQLHPHIRRIADHGVEARRAGGDLVLVLQAALVPIGEAKEDFGKLQFPVKEVPLPPIGQIGRLHRHVAMRVGFE